jgi:hypothetical protein
LIKLWLNLLWRTQIKTNGTMLRLTGLFVEAK